MPIEQTPGKPQTRRYSPEEKSAAVRMVRTLRVAPSTYYAAKSRPPSARAERDAVLTPQLVKLWEGNYRVYGARKLWKAARPTHIPRRRNRALDTEGNQ